MNAIEYYRNLGIDLTVLSLEERAVIGSSWLDDSIHTKEELVEVYGDRILIKDDDVEE